MREIITIHTGQAGVQISHAVWELACLEHCLNKSGEIVCGGEKNGSGGGLDRMFLECRQGNYSPRAVLLDLEPTVIDEIRVGSYRQLWNPTNMITGKEDAASSYARAFFAHARTYMPSISERIRLLVEQCDSLVCFKFIYSANGGTGSGLTSAVFDELSQTYGKKLKFATSVYPSPSYSETTVEPYNAILHTAATVDLCDCVVLTDNQAIHRAITVNLDEDTHGFTLPNRVIARVINAQFLAHRFYFLGQQCMDVTDLLINLVPFPRVHFPIMAYTPFVGRDAKYYENFTASQMLDRAYAEKSQLASICTSDQPYISCALLFRGDLQPCDAVEAVKNAKAGTRARFVEWCPTGFKMGINFTPPIRISDDCAMAFNNRSLSMLAGNVGIRDAWYTTKDHFDLLYGKRAFVHWYVAEGMEEGEFVEAEEIVENIIQDYEDIGKELDPNMDTTENHAATVIKKVKQRRKQVIKSVTKVTDINNADYKSSPSDIVHRKASALNTQRGNEKLLGDLNGLRRTGTIKAPSATTKSPKLPALLSVSSMHDSSTSSQLPSTGNASNCRSSLLGSSTQASHPIMNESFQNYNEGFINCDATTFVTAIQHEQQEFSDNNHVDMGANSQDCQEQLFSRPLVERIGRTTGDSNWSAAAHVHSEISLSESYSKVRLHSSISSIIDSPRPKPRSLRSVRTISANSRTQTVNLDTCFPSSRPQLSQHQRQSSPVCSSFTDQNNCNFTSPFKVTSFDEFSDDVDQETEIIASECRVILNDDFEDKTDVDDTRSFDSAIPTAVTPMASFTTWAQIRSLGSPSSCKHNPLTEARVALGSSEANPGCAKPVPKQRYRGHKLSTDSSAIVNETHVGFRTHAIVPGCNRSLLSPSQYIVPSDQIRCSSILPNSPSF